MTELCLKEFKKILEYEAGISMDWHSLESRQEINDGHCVDFASSVRDRIRRRYGDNHFRWSSDKPRVMKRSYGTRSLKSPSHVWLEYRELHFDAECTKGTQKPSNLPIFRRAGLSESQISG